MRRKPTAKPSKTGSEKATLAGSGVGTGGGGGGPLVGAVTMSTAKFPVSVLQSVKLTQVWKAPPLKSV